MNRPIKESLGDCISIEERYVTVDIYILKYFLLHEIKDDRDCFSIRVIQFSESKELCRAIAYDITDKADFALEIFSKIWKGDVFPVTLCDVVSNLLP